MALLQSGQHGDFSQLDPDLRPCDRVIGQKTVAQTGVQCHARVCVCRQVAAAAEPKRVDRYVALRVQRVGIEQHLHFILQAPQQALRRALGGHRVEFCQSMCAMLQHMV